MKMNNPINFYRVTEPREQLLFTLKDLALKNTSSPGYDVSPANYLSLSEVLTDRLGWSEYNIQGLDSVILNELWFKFILQTNIDEYVSVCDYSEELENADLSGDTRLFNQVFGKFMQLFLSILNKSYKRYSKLISLYKDNEQDLLKQIESVVDTKARDNEVPQATNIDPYDTSYANRSNVGNVVTKSDPATMGARLEEVRRMWYSIYEEWANEFNSLFITKP